jgi:hypothetical protein
MVHTPATAVRYLLPIRLFRIFHCLGDGIPPAKKPPARRLMMPTNP